MNDMVPAGILIAALLVAVYLVNRIGKAAPAGAAASVTPAPAGSAPGTLKLGQYAVQPGAEWLVLRPGEW